MRIIEKLYSKLYSFFSYPLKLPIFRGFCIKNTQFLLFRYGYSTPLGGACYIRLTMRTYSIYHEYYTPFYFKKQLFSPFSRNFMQLYLFFENLVDAFGRAAYFLTIFFHCILTFAQYYVIIKKYTCVLYMQSI